MAPGMNIVLVVLLLASATQALTYLECDCSPTDRGFRPDVLKTLQEAHEKTLAGIDERRSKMKTDSTITESTIQRYVSEKAGKVWDDCRKNYSWEECVNADAALRLCPSYPACSSYCTYDMATFTNTVSGKPRQKCDADPAFRSQDQDIVAGKFRSNTAVRPSPTPSPSPVSVLDVVNEEAPAVAASPNAEVTDAADVSPVPPTRVNEGCVAVEHLEGYVLQHRQHLSRAVLCSRGFCATPNHALIVQGQWTSMKQLCAGEWQCVQTVKLVNNLKVSANTRAVITDEITVTPYDVRFPIAAVWFVQMAEDAIYLLSIAFTLSAAVAGAVAASAHISI